MLLTLVDPTQQVFSLHTAILEKGYDYEYNLVRMSRRGRVGHLLTNLCHHFVKYKVMDA